MQVGLPVVVLEVVLTLLALASLVTVVQRIATVHDQLARRAVETRDEPHEGPLAGQGA